MSIKHWPSSERPREKLLQCGAEQLSSAELLAIFLRTGIKGKSAVDLARDLINHFGSLKNLFNASPDEFFKAPGLGAAKFAQLQAVLEMSRRYFFEEMKSKPILNNSKETKNYLLAKLNHYQQEVFGCLFLDVKNNIIDFELLFKGTIDRATVYPREIIKAALSKQAANIILAHNHPSGNVEPSQSDIELTQQLKKALQLVDINLLDHIIVGKAGALSMVEASVI